MDSLKFSLHYLLAPIITIAPLAAIDGVLLPLKANALPFNKSCKSMAAYANSKYNSGWKLVDFLENFVSGTYEEGGRTFERAYCDSWAGYAVRKTTFGNEVCRASMWYDSGGKAALNVLQPGYTTFFFLRGDCWMR